MFWLFFRDVLCLGRSSSVIHASCSRVDFKKSSGVFTSLSLKQTHFLSCWVKVINKSPLTGRTDDWLIISHLISEQLAASRAITMSTEQPCWLRAPPPASNLIYVNLMWTGWGTNVLIRDFISGTTPPQEHIMKTTPSSSFRSDWETLRTLTKVMIHLSTTRIIHHTQRKRSWNGSDGFNTDTGPTCYSWSPVAS